MINPFRQALKDLGLNDYDLRLISSLNSDIKKNKEYLQHQLKQEGIDLPSTSYGAVYNRLTTRGLSGKNAQAYTRSFVKSVKSEVQSIKDTGHTRYTYNKYKSICDYYGIDIDTWLNLDKKRQVEMLKDAIYDITGERPTGSDIEELLQLLNTVTNNVEENEKE